MVPFSKAISKETTEAFWLTEAGDQACCSAAASMGTDGGGAWAACISEADRHSGETALAPQRAQLQRSGNVQAPAACTARGGCTLRPAE
jgi:hypothetical protein